MSIYTKTGDKGSTSLFDGQRVKKYALRVDTYGVFDECGAQISVAEKLAKNSEIKEHLIWLQEKIFHLNAEIATAQDYQQLREKSRLIEEEDIRQLEAWVDTYQQQLPEFHRFILPGSSLAGAELHLARTVCRRGERRLIELSEKEIVRPVLKQFVNRLSDCLYTFARVEDQFETEQKLVAEIIKRYLAQTSRKSVTTFNYQLVQSIFSSCIDKALSMELPVTIAIVDKSGQLISSYRMEGSLLVSGEIAKKKAYSAVAMKQQTVDLQAIVQPGAEFYQLETITNGKVVTFAGGIPLEDYKGNIIGAIGVSGGSSQQDQSIALVGLEKFKEIGYGKPRN